MRPALRALTQQDRVDLVRTQAQELIELADEVGVSLRIDRVSGRPPAMGHARHVVDVWLARHQPVEAEPIPAGVYYSTAHTNFYDHNARGMGQEFMSKWHARASEFPTTYDALRSRTSDRERAARDPSLRDGSTVRVPGVGEL